MLYRTIKQILIGVLSGALIFVSAAYSQTDHTSTDPCPVRLRIFSFVEGTTDVIPVEAATVTFTEMKTKKVFELASANGEAFFQGLPQKAFDISVVKDGFRKSADTLQVDCLRTTQGAVNHFIIMWKGDPSKTVQYSRINETAGEKGGEKTGTQGAFKIGSAEPNSADRSGSRTLSKGVINGSAIILAKPKYPAAAMSAGVSGAVNVQVVIDQDGYIVAATAITGHPLLMSGSVLAARASRFKPTLLEGVPVKVTGIIVYNYQ
jgi:Gram-negative bacterial TonB protein C-terminal